VHAGQRALKPRRVGRWSEGQLSRQRAAAMSCASSKANHRTPPDLTTRAVAADKAQTHVIHAPSPTISQLGITAQLRRTTDVDVDVLELSLLSVATATRPRHAHFLMYNVQLHRHMRRDAFAGTPSPTTFPRTRAASIIVGRLVMPCPDQITTQIWVQ
jgi:hypothetical protein